MRFKYYLRGAGIGVIVATLVLSIAFLFHDDISDEEVIRRAMKLGMVMQENNAGTLSDISASGASKADLETGTDPSGSTKTDEDPLGQDGSDPSSTGTEPSGSEADTQTGQDSQSPDSPDNDGPSAGQDDQPSGTEPDNGQSQDSQTDDSKDDNDKNEKEDNKDKKGSKDDKPSDSEPDKQDEASGEVEIVIESGDVSRMVSAKVFEAGLVDDAAEFNAFLGANDYDNMLQPGTYKIKKGASFQEIARILTRQ